MLIFSGRFHSINNTFAPIMKAQQVRVTKKFTFDMAHALYGYDGPCKNIHGHTYHLSVTLMGTPIQNNSDVKLGMVVDFSDLKAIVKKNILATYDHALVLNEDAPYSKSEVISNEFEKVILVAYQPTCENLLLSFVEILKPHFPLRMKLISIRLEETPTSFAEWNESDN
jgi:6-pyruvoyltetrahydropterin/6-carboxytetrahydropterin synthase